jgi:hypothetical protein
VCFDDDTKHVTYHPEELVASEADDGYSDIEHYEELNPASEGSEAPTEKGSICRGGSVGSFGTRTRRSCSDRNEEDKGRGKAS